MELHNMWHTLLIYQEHKRLLFPNTHCEQNNFLCSGFPALVWPAVSPKALPYECFSSSSSLPCLPSSLVFWLLLTVLHPAWSNKAFSLGPCQYCPCQQALETKKTDISLMGIRMRIKWFGRTRTGLQLKGRPAEAARTGQEWYGKGS